MKPVKLFLWVVAVPFVLIQSWLTAGPGGIAETYGVMNAFPAYFEVSFSDPLLSAGIVDFVTVVVILLVWMITELPSETRWSWQTFLWIVAYGIFPGLGILLYFLWLNKEHRFVAYGVSE